jgi:hypothetical protein
MGMWTFQSVWIFDRFFKVSGGNQDQEQSIIDDSLPSSLLSIGRLPSNNKAGRICADTLYSGEVMYLDW